MATVEVSFPRSSGRTVLTDMEKRGALLQWSEAGPGLVWTGGVSD